MKLLKFRTTEKIIPAINTERDHFRRVSTAFILILICFGIVLANLIRLQIIHYDDYVSQALNNQISIIPTPPIRGDIIDANGIALAHNYPAYSLEIIPNQIHGTIDDTINKLRTYVNLSDGDLRRFQRFRAEFRSYEKIPLKLKLTIDEASKIAAHLYLLPGVEVNTRTFRDYPYGNLTAHIIGYIGRISDRDLKKLDDTSISQLYRGSTHIGKSGLEEFYERQLHGLPGYQEVEKDAQGNIVRMLKDIPPTTGQTLQLTLDIRVQQEADRLLGNRRGAIVAINPQTGGIIAMVSKPSFNPNLFIDGIDTETWEKLNDNWQRPLINRTIQGLYPPGSTFKPFMAMAALESGFIKPYTILPAPGVWSIPNTTHQFRDSVRSGHGNINLSKAIQVSSDTFFYQIGYGMGIDKVAPYLAEFGLGEQTGIDLNHEYRGILPTRAWKEKRFNKSPPSVRAWKPADMVSASIGQGYNAYTPLQMAHATATLANNGLVYQPHLVRQIIDHNKKTITIIDPDPIKKLNFQAAYFNYVKQAMGKVLQEGGTASRIGQGLTYTMGGKTGTAQVVQIKQGEQYHAASLSEKYRDHAWFISFAPLEKPQIAIAVILENGGWGANAAPIARALSDFYLLKLPTLPPPEKIAASESLNNHKKSYQPPKNFSAFLVPTPVKQTSEGLTHD